MYFGPGRHECTNQFLSTDGASGNPISWIGDFDGSMTDDVGGPVVFSPHSPEAWEPWFGIIAIDADYWTFENIVFSMAGGIFGSGQVYVWDNRGVHTGLTFRKCVWLNNGLGYYPLALNRAINSTVDSCVFGPGRQNAHILINTASQVNDAGVKIQNCYFQDGPDYALYAIRTGGITIRGCTIYARTAGVRSTALAAGFTPIDIQGCIFYGWYACYDGGIGEIVEDYNTVATNLNHLNTAQGANSHFTDPTRLEPRLWCELVNGSSLVSPADIPAGDVALTRSAGANMPATDMRGATRTSGTRGALDYNAALEFVAGGGGGGTRRSRAQCFGRG